MQVFVNGTLTHYKKYGSSENPTLVILHGWMRSMQDWISTAEALKDKYEVVLVDMPGFGRTPKPEGDLNTNTYADFVEEFLHELEIEKYILLGHSFGGRVGITLAARGSKINKLILIDSAGTETRNLTTRLKMFIIGKLLKPVSLLLPKKFVWQMKNVIGSSDYKHAGEMREVLVNVVSENLSDLLPKISVPTLVVWGEKDDQLPLLTGKIMKEAINGSKFRVVWGAGHNPHLEKPAKFIEILREFI